jgi:DNA-binding MarR family transcriptional regulator
MARTPSRLSEQDRRLWKSWSSVNALVPVALQRELQDAAGLSLPDFTVLDQLVAVPEHRLRVSDLARMLGWQRTRLSHHVTRMADRDLVSRQDCADDGRGAFVTVTAGGRSAHDRAAPAHAAALHAHLFDALTKAEQRTLAALSEKVRQHCERACERP